MNNDVAIFLDLDNLVIGAKQANLVFDINLVLDHIKELTHGRIVLRYACGAAQQSQALLQELAQAGFVVQATTRVNSYSKNLADMQIVVSAMDTLIDGHQYNTYVIMSGDRDFTPLVQSLRKRGKHVIGVGMRDTTSSSLVELCDEYILYDDLVTQLTLSNVEIEAFMAQTRDHLLKGQDRVRASIYQERLTELSQGRFGRSTYPDSSFRKFLARYPHLVHLEQEKSTIYVRKPQTAHSNTQLYARYRTALKKRRRRVVPPDQRFTILRDLIGALQREESLIWGEIPNTLTAKYENNGAAPVSKNSVNAMLLLAREAEIIRTLRGRSLATAPVVLNLAGERPFQQAVIRLDQAYLRAILDLPERFDIEQAAFALYDDASYAAYLQRLTISMNSSEPAS